MPCEQLCTRSLIWLTLMFHLICFDAVHVAFFQTIFPHCFSSFVPGVQIRFEMHGGRGGLFGDVRQQGAIHLLGTGSGGSIAARTSGERLNENLHKECQILLLPAES